MDSFLAAKAEDIISCTGFSLRLIRTYMQQFAIPEDHVLHLCAAFVMAHMDVSDIQLPIVMRVLSSLPVRSSATLSLFVNSCMMFHL